MLSSKQTTKKMQSHELDRLSRGHETWESEGQGATGKTARWHPEADAGRENTGRLTSGSYNAMQNKYVQTKTTRAGKRKVRLGPRGNWP